MMQKKVLGSILILILTICIQNSQSLECMTVNTPCKQCFIYCDQDFNNTCGYKIPLNETVTFLKTSGGRENLTLLFTSSYCQITKLEFKNDNRQRWNVKFTSQYQETVLNITQLQFGNVNSFESEYVTFAKIVNDNNPLFYLEGTQNFRLEGNVFKRENLALLKQAPLMTVRNSVAYLQDVTITGLGNPGSETVDLFRVQTGSQLYFTGNQIEISNNSVQNALFYIQDNNSTLFLMGSQINIKNNRVKQHGLARVDTNDPNQPSKFFIQAGDSLTISNNSGIEQAAFLYLWNSVASIQSDNSINFDRNCQESVAPLVVLQKQSTLTIKSAGTMTYSNNNQILIKSNQILPSQQNILLQGKDIVFLNNLQLFSLFAYSHLEVSSSESILFRYSEQPSDLHNASLLVSSKFVNFTSSSDFITLNYSSLDVNSARQITVDNSQSYGSEFINQYDQSSVSLSSKGKIDIFSNFENLFNQSRFNQLTIRADEEISIVQQNLYEGHVILSDTQNKITITSGKSIYLNSYQPQSNLSVSLIKINSTNFLTISANGDIVLGGKDSTLPYIDPYRTVNQGVLITSLKKNTILVNSKARIVIENIATPDQLFRLNDLNLTSDFSNFSLVAQSDIIFRNIHSNSYLIYQGSNQNQFSLISQGQILFSSIQTSTSAFYLREATNLNLTSNTGIAVQDIGGNYNNYLEQFFMVYLRNSRIYLSSKGLITFSRIYSVFNQVSFGSNETFIVSLDYPNQLFSLKSETGVSIDRPSYILDYQKYDETSILDLEWVFFKDQKFLPCLSSCLKCSNGIQCERCKPGTYISSDKTQCLNSSEAVSRENEPEQEGTKAPVINIMLD